MLKPIFLKSDLSKGSQKIDQFFARNVLENKKIRNVARNTECGQQLGTSCTIALAPVGSLK